MIEELLQIDLDETLFPGPQVGMVLSSITAGNTNGRLWRVGGAGKSVLLLLWDQGNNVFYLSGDADPALVHEAATLIQSEIQESAIRLRRIYFKVRTLSAALESAIPELFCGFHLHKVDKLFYRYPKAAVPVLPVTMEGVRYQHVDAAFLAQGQYANIDAVKSEVAWMWSSPAASQAYFFGVVALVGDAIVCWCTAEYVSERMCGIGIETVADFQNKGIATATAAHFVAESLRRQLTPHWECVRQNIGSKRVAEKVGFSLLSETSVWSGRF